MEEPRFKIVFQKLAELADDESEVGGVDLETDRLRAESFEISELRRLSAELSEPPTRFFTGT